MVINASTSFTQDSCISRTLLSLMRVIRTLPGSDNLYQCDVFLKVEVQYVDYGNTEELPISNLREPVRAIDHVNSLPFQVL